MERELNKRSESKCELCSSDSNLKPYKVPSSPNDSINESIYICDTCSDQLENPDKINPNHWRCLNDSMWSTVPAVQVVAYRMLNKLKPEGWPADLIDMMYLDDETMEWAKAGMTDEDAVVHVDSNGVVLQPGDSVVLIKDLKVKGTSMVAKRGTAVRRISLVADNPEHIEGKVEGQRIVILTQFVKKS